MKFLKYAILFAFLISIFAFSCNEKNVNIKTNYFDLPSDNSVILKNTLKTDDDNQLTNESFEIIKDYLSKYLLVRNNPISWGIVSNYFYYIYNALPDFIDENERHQGYYANENKQNFEEKLIAYSIYRIDRSPENLQTIFVFIKPELTTYLSKSQFQNLDITSEIDGLIESYNFIAQIDNYKYNLTEAYNHADTATGSIYINNDEYIFEPFNSAYGFDTYTLSEMISQHLQLDRHSIFFSSTHLSFWMRRNHEGNMETVYKILTEVKEIYQ
jgi:hypothetical protein